MAGFPKLSLTLISSSFLLFLSLLPVVIATGNYGPDTCRKDGSGAKQAQLTTSASPLKRDLKRLTTTLKPQLEKIPTAGPMDLIPFTRICLARSFHQRPRLVTPATRTEAAYDNTQASNRRASLNTWTSIYYEFGYPLLQVHGDHFNFGPVKLVFNSTGEVAYFEETVNATAQAGYVAGAFSYPTYLLVCASTSLPPNAQVSVYDPISDRWSTPLFLRAGQSC